MRIEYTAKRNLAAGHSVDANYEIVVLGENIEPEFAFAQIRNVSLDRSRVEVDLLGIEQTVDVATDLIAIGAGTAGFEEFLHSVAAGETFIFDGASDTAATPVDPKTVILESKGYKRERPIPGYYRYRFTARVI